MEDQNKRTIPTEYLPDNYRASVGELFSIQPDTVGRIANGTRKNDKVFDYLLELAEKGKQAEIQRLERLGELTQPINQ